MKKRKAFYVNTEILGKGLGPHEIAVYVYLSFCANAEGQCFPSLGEIAQEVCVSESSVKRAIKALCGKGLLIKEPRFHPAKCGRSRTGSNLYTLVGSAAGVIHMGVKTPPVPEPHRGSHRTPPGVTQDPNINNKYINPRGLTPSLSYKTQNGGKLIFEDDEIEHLLERLDPHIYDDEHYGNAVEAALREMWFARGIKVDGEFVKQVNVRKRLRLLNIDCLDEVYRALGEATDVVNLPQYLKICLYNAPLRVGAQIARGCSELNNRSRAEELARFKREVEEQWQAKLAAKWSMDDDDD